MTDERPETTPDPTPETESPQPDSPQPNPQHPEPTTQSPDDPDPDIDAVRDLIARAYPDTVPELIEGATASEMLASVPAAQEAYRRVAEQAHESTPPGPGGPVSRSGSVDVESLSPEVKIRQGLRG